MKRIIANLLISAGMIALMSGCANTYFVTGTVTGLTGGGTLTLQNNGGDTTQVTGSNFSFAIGVVDNLGYNVMIVGQPNGLSCSTLNGVGTIKGANAVVTITCTPIAPGPKFTIGGNVVAAAVVAPATAWAPYTASPLVISHSGFESLTLAAGPLPRSFTFPTSQPFGTSYSVSVTTDTLGPQTCTVTNGATGVVGGSNVTNVVVSCGGAYGISGTVTGVPAGRTVTISDDGAVTTTAVAGVGTGATTIPFNLTPQAAGSHTVTATVAPVALQPNITCTVTSTNPVVITTANVTNVVVACI